MKEYSATSAILKFYFRCLCEIIDRFKDSGISIKYTNSLISIRNAVPSPDLPFHLVVIPDLHDFISFAEKLQSLHFLFLILDASGGFRYLLEDLIQSFHAKKSFPHRSQDLNIKRLRLYISWKFILDQGDHHTDDDVRIVSLKEKEIPAFVIKDYLLSLIDLMRIYNNITL